MNQACTRCQTTEPHADVIPCASCETLTCCDCRTAPQEILHVCSDDCLEREILSLQTQALALRTQLYRARVSRLPEIPQVALADASPVAIEPRKVA